MSLINDALKRAKEAQAKAPPPEASIPHLRPVEPEHSGPPDRGLLLPAALTLVALGGLFCLWQAAPNTLPVQAANATPVDGRARSPLRAAAAPEAGTAPAPTVNRRRAEDSAPHPRASLPTTPTPAPVVSNVPPSAPGPQVASALPGTSLVATNLSSPPVPVVAKPAPPRLQAIVFNPAHPSAMINGKTVFVGDRIGAWRVLAIDQQSATLAGAGATNILTLSD